MRILRDIKRAVWICCATSGLAATAWAEDMPPWLQEALARESSELPTQSVQLESAGVTTIITGTLLQTPEDFEDGTYAQTDIGGDAALECVAYNFAADPAALVVTLAEGAIDAAAANYGAINTRILTAVKSAAFDAVPYHYLEWTYTAGAPPDARVNMVKAAVAYFGERTLACNHNEVGYRQTFAQAFERFVRSARIQGSPTQPYYEEIILFSLGQQSLGYTRVSMTLDEDGDTVSETLTSMLSPTDAQNVKSSDGFKTAYSTPDGFIINGTDSEASDGELVYALELGPSGEADWAVSGEFHGKPYAATLEVSEPPRSDLGQMRLLRELVNNKKQRVLQFPIYSPGADPSAFIMADVILDPGGSDTGAARLTIGPIVMDVQIDATGSIPQGTMDLGVGKMRIERVWQAGEIE